MVSGKEVVFFKDLGRGLNPGPRASEEDALSTPLRPTWRDRRDTFVERVWGRKKVLTWLKKSSFSSTVREVRESHFSDASTEAYYGSPQ